MNKMIKSILVAAGVMASATVMADSYLYWMSEGAGTVSGWSYAKVAYSDGTSTGYLAPTDGSGTEFSASDMIGGDFFGMQVAIGSLTLSSSYKFALELFSSSDTKVASSAWLAYSSTYVGNESFSSEEAKFSGFSVPEPTSGMLSLLGFALLALRRKRVNA